MKKIRKKILIVEDDKDFLSILKIKFESEGFSVITAKDGQEGVSLAEKENPDLILSDVLMTGMDGIEMAKRIQNSNKNAIIIFLTNLKDVSYVKEIDNSPNFVYLVKSDLRISDIVEKVKEKL